MTLINSHTTLHTVKWVTDLTTDPDWNTNDDGRDSNGSNKADTDGSTDQGAQLPKNLLLPTPRLLTPERTTGRTATDVNSNTDSCTIDKLHVFNTLETSTAGSKNFQLGQQAKTFYFPSNASTNSISHIVMQKNCTQACNQNCRR